jgi:hypothetical protein
MSPNYVKFAVSQAVELGGIVKIAINLDTLDEDTRLSPFRLLAPNVAEELFATTLHLLRPAIVRTGFLTISTRNQHSLCEILHSLRSMTVTELEEICYTVSRETLLSSPPPLSHFYEACQLKTISLVSVLPTWADASVYESLGELHLSKLEHTLEWLTFRRVLVAAARLTLLSLEGVNCSADFALCEPVCLPHLLTFRLIAFDDLNVRVAEFLHMPILANLHIRCDDYVSWHYLATSNKAMFGQASMFTLAINHRAVEIGQLLFPLMSSATSIDLQNSGPAIVAHLIQAANQPGALPHLQACALPRSLTAFEGESLILTGKRVEKFTINWLKGGYRNI